MEGEDDSRGSDAASAADDQIDEQFEEISDQNGVSGDEDEDGDDVNDEEDEDGDEDNVNDEDDDEHKAELSQRKLQEYNEMMDRRGVVYLARVPPFMKINKVRHMMEQYGKVTRIYLVEEDASIRRRRRKSGGNGSKRYTEGWIEFSDKKIARRVAESLNNTNIGGKKGSFYHDDIWNLKYLKGFKWEHLTEKLAYERRVREQKLMAQSMQDRRNAQEFVELLDKNTAYEKIQERKRKRGDAAIPAAEPESNKPEKAQPKRKFRQTKPLSDQAITLG